MSGWPENGGQGRKRWMPAVKQISQQRHASSSGRRVQGVAAHLLPVVQKHGLAFGENGIFTKDSAKEAAVISLKGWTHEWTITKKKKQPGPGGLWIIAALSDIRKVAAQTDSGLFIETVTLKFDFIQRLFYFYLWTLKPLWPLLNNSVFLNPKFLLC